MVSNDHLAGNLVHQVSTIDRDGDNQLDAFELQSISPDFLRRLGVPDATVTELVQQFDRNGDRTLDQGERQGLVARMVPELVKEVETTAHSQDFHKAGKLNRNVEGLKVSMREDFSQYIVEKQSNERSGLYNFQQHSADNLEDYFDQRASLLEADFLERRTRLDRQFAMRRDVLFAETRDSRPVGKALVPKQSTHALELRASLHHLARQKRFDEAEDLQRLLDSLDSEKLAEFKATQPAYVDACRKELTAEYEKACQALERRRRAAQAKLMHEKDMAVSQLHSQGRIYRRRIEHCHVKSAQPLAVAGVRPVRVPAIPTLSSLQHAATTKPERTRGADGHYQLSLPPMGRKPSASRQPLHAPASYMAEPLWARKGLLSSTFAA
mmetsp:Transcript_21294/g.50818  ORF Transcript_21294/g.50818 Transcript_21294/m.50818 type:complete len:382 (+) Transcript_21294:69-1214(+)